MWSGRSWTFKAAIVKVLIRKWLIASLGTDGSCLLHEGGLALSTHDSQQGIRILIDPLVSSNSTYIGNISTDGQKNVIYHN